MSRLLPCERSWDHTDQRGSEIEGAEKLSTPSRTLNFPVRHHLILELTCRLCPAELCFTSNPCPFSLCLHSWFSSTLGKTYIQYKYYPCTSSLCYFLCAGSAVCRAYLESHQGPELPTAYEKYCLTNSFTRSVQRSASGDWERYSSPGMGCVQSGCKKRHRVLREASVHGERLRGVRLLALCRLLHFHCWFLNGVLLLRETRFVFTKNLGVGFFCSKACM